MKKSTQITTSIIILIIGVLLLASDRLFVSAANASYSQSMTIVTLIALFLFLVGVIWLYRTTLK